MRYPKGRALGYIKKSALILLLMYMVFKQECFNQKQAVSDLNIFQIGKLGKFLNLNLNDECEILPHNI